MSQLSHNSSIIAKISQKFIVILTNIKLKRISFTNKKIMRLYFWLILSFLQFACSSQQVNQTVTNLYLHQSPNTQKTHHNIAFGSCNKHLFPQDYWTIIAKQKPDLWIWLGDIVYADTDNETALFNAYNTLFSNVFYQNFIRNTPVTGIWDDHDYGKNDGGKDFKFKHFFITFSELTCFQRVTL